jgi:hypothetical protein
MILQYHSTINLSNKVGLAKLVRLSLLVKEKILVKSFRFFIYFCGESVSFHKVFFSCLLGPGHGFHFSFLRDFFMVWE